MNVNTEVKGTLAKLLATENLTVEHRKVSPASFDVNNRVLILPIWKNASSIVYDLLVGHEVGHALYTPNIPVDAPKAFVNVIEDVRIERMMKQTYPGLKKSFFEGYRELWHQDFFGVADEDIQELAFIDRINLYFKGNTEIEFTDEEQVYVNRAAKTRNFQDVIDLANDLYAYAQSKEDQKETQKQEDIDWDGPVDSDEQEKVTPDESEGSDEVKKEDYEYDEGGQGGSQEKDPADLNTPSYSGGTTGGDHVDETESVTEQALRQAIETLVDEDAQEWVYLDLPKVNLDKVITDHKQIQEDLIYHFEGQAYEDKRTHDYYQGNLYEIYQDYQEYKKDAQKSVNYLVKQFEMKKSADQYKRAAVSKTGVINTNALHKYKISDDIFKRITTVPDGKNHGLIMFLDWSGSMQHNLLDTLKQTYNLVWFCRKAGIPFRVYAFQNGWSNNRTHPAVTPKKNTLTFCEDFKLLEFFSSRQNAKSLELSMKLAYTQATSMIQHGVSYCQKYTLGGTPLGEAIMCARQLVARLKKVENVTKVNVISLTDGEANPLTYTKERGEDYYTHKEVDEELNLWTASMNYSRKKYIVRDNVTGYSREFNPSPYETTKEIVSFYREITDYNWIGIRICSKSEFNRTMRHLSYDESQKLDLQWKRQKFASVKNQLGFSQSFYIPDRGIGDATDDLEVKQKGEVATKAELNRAFKKHMGSKMTNKTVLNAFIEQIA